MAAEALSQPEAAVPSGGEDPGGARGLVYKGKWRVLHPLVETDRSYLFLGSPVQGGRPVAIKVLKERRARDTRFMKLHHADMQAAMALPRHPALVQVLDAGWVNGRYVVVSEFAPGEPISARLGKPRALPWPAILAATRQLVALLAFAQETGIRFRHVEPEHLLLEEDERRVHLLRFSLPRSARLGIDPPRGVGPDLQLAGDLMLRMVLGDEKLDRSRAATAELLGDRLKERIARVYPEVTPDEVHEIADLYVRSATRDGARRLESYAAMDSLLAHLEGSHRPLQEERRRREREERRESLLATAYDTVMALTGREPARVEAALAEPLPEEDDDLRERRIQVFLLVGTLASFLALAIAALN